MRLWTIQDEMSWKKLQEEGIYMTQEKYLDPDFKNAYDWLVNQMIQRIGKSPFPNQYPIWAWYQWQDSSRKRPDLRESAHLPKGKIGYRLEIEKAEAEVLLSDFELWHNPLCYKSYIADSEEELLRFEKAFGKVFNHASFEKQAKKVQKRIERSWEKIFDLDFDVEYFARPRDKKSIQATFWELRLEEVVKVDRFIAR